MCIRCATGPSVGRGVGNAALPARCELTFVSFPTLRAAPVLALGRGTLYRLEQGLSTRQVLVAHHPKLGQTIEKGNLTQTAGELIVLDQAGNPRLLQKILQVPDMGQRLVCDQPLQGCRVSARSGTQAPQERCWALASLEGFDQGRTDDDAIGVSGDLLDLPAFPDSESRADGYSSRFFHGTQILR